MKKSKKIAALILALAMLLCLSACGMFETRMARAAVKMQKLESMRMDMDLDLGLDVSLLGASEDMNIGIHGSGDVLLDPLIMRMILHVDAVDEKLETLYYVRQNGQEYQVFFSPDDGETWMKETAEGEALPAQAPTAEQLKFLLKCAESFAESGKETIKGSQATVYSGVIEGENLDVILAASGVMEALSEALEMDLSDVEVSRYGSVPCTIAIDNRSGMVVRYTLDLTQVLQGAMDEAIQGVLQSMAEDSLLGGLDLSGLGFHVELSRAMTTVTLYDFDQVGEIQIPQEALDA